MDEIQQAVNELLQKHPTALTDTDKAFLRARWSYLNTDQQAVYAEILGVPRALESQSEIKAEVTQVMDQVQPKQDDEPVKFEEAPVTGGEAFVGGTESGDPPVGTGTPPTEVVTEPMVQVVTPSEVISEPTQSPEVVAEPTPTVVEVETVAVGKADATPKEELTNQSDHSRDPDYRAE
jgi:hypothetical protein